MINYKKFKLWVVRIAIILSCFPIGSAIAAKLSSYSTATNMTTSDLFPILQGGANKNGNATTLIGALNNSQVAFLGVNATWGNFTTMQATTVNATTGNIVTAQGTLAVYTTVNATDVNADNGYFGAVESDTVNTGDFESNNVTTGNITCQNFTAASYTITGNMTGDLDVTGNISATGTIDATGNVSGANLNPTEWDTAYGWGDHSSQNYFDKDTDTLDNVTDGSTYKLLTATKDGYIDQDVTSGSSPTFNATNFTYVPADQVTGNLSASTLLGIDSDDITQGSTNIYANTTKEDNGQTAYGWGDHGSAGYLLPTTNSSQTSYVESLTGGSAFSFTADYSPVIMNSTTCQITLPESGKWLLIGGITCMNNNVTSSTPQYGLINLYRTNNTPAVIENSAGAFFTGILTNETSQAADLTTNPCIYTTANTDDTIGLYGYLTTGNVTSGSIDGFGGSLIGYRIDD
jgi:hypothetical protein